MEIKTILNRVQRHSLFGYGAVRVLEESGGFLIEVEVEIRGWSNSRARCSGCGNLGPGYDTLTPRRFEFVPLWGIPVFFLYAMRRVDCHRCNVRVEVVARAEGKSTLTTTYSWLLAGWAKRMSWKGVAEAFRTSWEKVFRSVEMAAAWVRARMSLEGIGSIGVDEIQWQSGHKYLTLVYQIDVHFKRLLWIGQDRKIRTLLRFFSWPGKPRSQALRFICSDMWKPYLRVIAKKAGQAIHVLDRFHIMSHFNGKRKLITKRAFGFRTFHAAEIALYHAPGKLPEPEFTHRFC